MRLQIPLPEAVVCPFGGQRQPLAYLPELMFRAYARGDVMPQQGHTADDGQDLDFQNRRICARAQSDVTDRARLAIRKRPSDGPRHLRPGQLRHGKLERTPKHRGARTSKHALECIVPQRHVSVRIDHRHPVLQKVDDLATTVRLFEPVAVIGVHRVREEQRRPRDWQHSPHLVTDHFSQRRCDARTNQIHRASAERRAFPRSIHRLTREQRDYNFGEPAAREMVSDHRCRDRYSAPRPGEFARDTRKGVHRRGSGEGRNHGDSGIDEELRTWVRLPGIDETWCHGSNGRDQRRYARTEQQEGREDDDEDRWHDRPVLRRRLHRPQRSSENR